MPTDRLPELSRANPNDWPFFMRRPLAGVVTGGRVLDLDDLGAEVAQHPAAGRRGVHRAELEDAHAGQRAAASAVGHASIRPSTGCA